MVNSLCSVGFRQFTSYYILLHHLDYRLDDKPFVWRAQPGSMEGLLSPRGACDESAPWPRAPGCPGPCPGPVPSPGSPSAACSRPAAGPSPAPGSAATTPPQAPVGHSCGETLTILVTALLALLAPNKQTMHRKSLPRQSTQYR